MSKHRKPASMAVRKRTLRAIHSIMDAAARPMQRQLRAEFLRVGKRAQHAWPKKISYQDHKHRLRAIILPAMKTAAVSGARFARSMHRHAHLKAAGVPETKLDSEDELDARIYDWAVEQAGYDVTDITARTESRLHHILASSIGDRLSPADIAERITDSISSMSESRALTIARTESAKAVNTGQHMEMLDASEQLGLETTKTWVATQDAKTRDTHLAADGQSVWMADPFDVGDDELQYPSDPDGSAEETINCRCAVTYNMQQDH